MREQLLNVDQLAAWLNLPRATIYNWVHERKLPFVKVGPRLRFREDEIRSWLEVRAHAAESGAGR